MLQADTSPSGNSPRVSIVLLAYNQENMIEHAVAGLFAQDYPDLEILLSDDCSTDGTLARLHELAAAYKGPARVAVYRTHENRGILSHWLEAVAQTTGEFVVMAAGDDVSYPHRVRTSVDTLVREQADACYSAYDFIDDDGRVWARHVAIRDLSMMLCDYFESGVLEPIHGASSVYRRHVFDGITALDTPVFFEDTFFTLSITLADGRIAFIDEPLVQVRHHAGSVTNHVLSEQTVAAVARQEEKQLFYAGSLLAVLHHFAPRIRQGAAGRARRALEDDLALFDLRATWTRRPLRDLWTALPRARRRRHLSWLVPRLVGARTFLRAKSLRYRWGRPRGLKA